MFMVAQLVERTDFGAKARVVSLQRKDRRT